MSFSLKKVLSSLRSSLRPIVQTLGLVTLSACFNEPVLVTTQNDPVVVDPGKTVCDPFANNPSHIGANQSNGIVAAMSFLPESSKADYSKSLPYYKTNATPVDATLFFSELNVPTRSFDLGFTTQDGTLITNEKGTKLYEYFSLHFDTRLKLLAGDAEGPYQLALLSDDGAVLQMDLSQGTTPTASLVDLVSNDGTHPSKFVNASVPVNLQRGVPLPISIDYYQGPRFHIALMLLWRPWPRGAGAPSTQDLQNGKQGNSLFFDYTQVPSTPKQAYLDMLSRGWKVVPEANFALPTRYTTNPCVGAAPPPPPPVAKPTQDTSGTIELFASKTYGPSTWFNGAYQIFYPTEITIPAFLTVTSGNAGNHYSSLQIDQMTCLYQGGSSQSHPSGTTQVNLGLKYIFKYCVDAVVAPFDLIAQNAPKNSITAGSKVVVTNQLILRVDNGDSYKSPTMVQAILPTYVDVAAPVIALTTQDNVLTRNPSFTIAATVTDGSLTTTRIIQNGVQVLSTTDSVINYVSTLAEGLNTFEIFATDAYGNISTRSRLNSITLDSIAPQILSLSPGNGSTVSALSFPVSGEANESLNSATLNGVPLSLGTNRRSFSGSFTSSVEGAQVLSFILIDLAGNSLSITSAITISSRILNGSLVSVSPAADGLHLVISGAMGAARPRSNIRASGSLFNNATTTAAADGTFSLILLPFTQATVTATDISSGASESTTVFFGLGTSTFLSGRVLDTSGRPISGVTVSLASNQTVQPVLTGADGVFLFRDPATGNQTLSVDGTTVVDANRSFFRTNISISIGLSQSNVLPRPIYLTPVPKTGVPVVSTQGGATVTSPDAPGVSLSIPSKAGAVKFPNGAASAPIYMAKIASASATVEPPSFAAPQNVITLEPSGTAFTTRAELTLPNDYGLPAGVELVILSMNSSSGKWEVDGAAQVSANGSTIKTKPGMGISHFSTIYASPLGPTTLPLGDADRPGATTFDGALTTTVDLPSFKSMGSDLAPRLIYNSAWAKPSTVISNLFDIPRHEVSLQDVPGLNGSSRTSLNIKTCVLFCTDNPVEIYTDSFAQGTAWYEPDYVTASFRSASIQTDPEHPLKFTGVPARAKLSYALDLKDPNSGTFLPSGSFPYSAHYDVHLNQITVGTRTIVTRTNINPTPQYTVLDISGTDPVAQAFPSDLGGSIMVSNEIDSAAGRGWKIAGTKKIIGTGSGKIVIDEGDGSFSTYNLANGIETLFDASAFPSKRIDLKSAVDFNQWPIVHVSATGTIAVAPGGNPNGSGASNFILKPAVSYSLDLSQANPVPLEIAEVLSTYDEIMTKLDPANPNIAPAGYISRVLFDEFVTPATPTDPIKIMKFRGLLHLPTGPVLVGIGIGFEDPVNGQFSRSTILQSSGNIFKALIGNSVPPTTGRLTNGAGTFRFGVNTPRGMALGLTPNTVVLADSGNNAVNLLDLNTSTQKVIAGNYQFNAIDTGDGGLATKASLRHPMAVLYDSLGNLYISSGDSNGLIRKVDPNGVISTVAGSQTDSEYVDVAPANRMHFNNPTGMVLDENNQYLYVADTGNNRVVRVDLINKVASRVAGTGEAANGSDGPSALDSALNKPMWLGLDDQKNLIIGDSGNNKIKRVIFRKTTSGTLAYVRSGSKTQGARRTPSGTWIYDVQRNSDQTWTRNYRNGTTESYSSDGLITQIKDRIGNISSVQYENGRIRTFTDPVGQTITYNYMGSRLDSISDSTGRPATRFQYYPNGDLQTVIYPDSSRRNFAYSNDGLMSSQTDQSGFVTSYFYNEWHRLKQTIHESGARVELADSGSKTVGNPSLDGSSVVMQPVGTQAGGATDDVVAPNGGTIGLAKDARGIVSSITTPAGDKTDIQHDLAGNPTQVEKSSGSSRTLVYEPIYGDLVSQTDSETGFSISQTFDEYGNLTSKTNARGYKNFIQYDSRGLVSAEINAFGNASGGNPRFQKSYSYNSRGQVLTITDEIGRVTTIAYDSLGNAVSTQFGAKTTVFERDAAGNVTKITAPGNQVTLKEYDIWNRLTKVTSPNGVTVSYAYSPIGKIREVKDSNGNITTLEYDSLGRMVKKTDTSGGVLSRAYNANGNVIQETDPNGNLKKFEYNSDDKLVKKILPDNLIQLTYDSKKNLESARDNGSLLTFGYDVAGSLTQASFQDLLATGGIQSTTLTFERDQNGNRTRMTDPYGLTVYAFDALDRLTGFTENALSQSRSYSYQFDDASNLVSITRPGTRSTILLDSDGLLKTLSHQAGSQTLVSYVLGREASGNITHIQQGGVNRTLAYDLDNQLLSATNPEASGSAQTESFSYDKVYNRVQDQGGSYSYDQNYQSKNTDRLISDYRYFYFYDFNGNLISKQAKGMTGEVTNYTYTTENQLIAFQVYRPTGVWDPSHLWSPTGSPVKQVNYRYDAIGRRIEKKVYDVDAPTDVKRTFTRRFAYDGQEILLEMDGNNALLARYTHSGLSTDDLLAVNVTLSGVSAGMAQAPGQYTLLKDYIGSINDVLDSGNNLVQHNVYSAFGEKLAVKNAVGTDISAQPALDISFAFAGRELDRESGFYYSRARYLDSTTGRFLQRDPNPGSLSLPISVINSYAYAGNNPFSNTDPSGQSFWGVLLAVVLIAVAAVVAVAVIAAIASVSATVGAVVGTAVTGSSTGGLLSGIIGGIAGAAVGAAMGAVGGAVAGGLVGGGLAVANGGSFAEGFKQGAITGAAIGARIGASIGAASGFFGGTHPLATLSKNLGTYASNADPYTLSAGDGGEGGGYEWLKPETDAIGRNFTLRNVPGCSLFASAMSVGCQAATVAWPPILSGTGCNVLTGGMYSMCTGLGM